MKLFIQYIKQRWRGIAVAILFCVIFAITFALYHLPIEAVLYPAAICGALGLMLLVIDFRRVLVKHKKLERIRTITDIMAENFPQVEGMEDADYQQIILLLADEQAQFRTTTNQRYDDMVDYYTIWAHQIKTPIAAMRLTLQNEDSALSRKLSGDLFRIEQYEGILVNRDSHQNFELATYESVGYVHIISLENYNDMMGTAITLEADECLLHCFRTKYSGDTFTIENCQPLRVKEVLDEMYVSGYAAMQMVPTITLVVSDIPGLVEPLSAMKNSWGYDVMEVFWSYDFNLDGDEQAQIDAYDRLCDEIQNIVIPNEDGSMTYSLNCRAAERTTFLGLYAGLFFIGVLLSIIFLFAAVLIIYYKQISEGYEDQKRFAVMQNVGMTKRDIRKSINSQVLTVFFTPLLLAGLHLAFAFPIIWKLLQLFNFTNLKLMILVTVGCFLVFALVYAFVYKLTSNAYFSIVSGAKEE